MKKKGGCGSFVWVLVLLGAIWLAVGSAKDKVAEKLISEEKGNVWIKGYTDLDDFEYYLNGGKIYITGYEKDASRIRINSSYNVGGNDCQVVSVENAPFIGGDIISISFAEGIAHIEDNTLNSCGAKYIFIPSSVTDLDEDFLDYLHDAEKLYFGGTQEQWDMMFNIERSDIDVKQIFCEVDQNTLGTPEAERVPVVVKEKKELESEPEQTYSDYEEEYEYEYEELSQDEQFAKDLSGELSEGVISKLYAILTNQMGFEEVEYVCKNDMGDSNYDINCDEYGVTVSASDDVYRMICGDYVLYENGQVLMTGSDLDDIHISTVDEVYYYDIAKEIVENNLKSPSTADFPTLLFSHDDIRMQKLKDVVVVQSYVDSQNSFGAMTRSEWIVEFRIIDKDNFDYDVMYINIDGSTYGNYTKL